MKYANASDAGQSFFVHGNGYRGIDPYLFVNFRYKNDGYAKVFVYENSSPFNAEIIIPITITIPNNTYILCKIAYDHSNSSYQLSINGSNMGSVTTTTDQQKFTVINDILFFPFVDTWCKDLVLYEGVVV